MPSCSLLNLLERIRIYKDKIALFWEREREKIQTMMAMKCL
jgi:hypothetical protein